MYLFDKRTLNLLTLIIWPPDSDRFFMFFLKGRGLTKDGSYVILNIPKVCKVIV